MAQEKPTEAKPSGGATNPSGQSEMARGSTALSPPSPSWFTPKRLLIIFCVINLINYVDRGTIASNGVNGSRRTCTESGTCTSGSGIQGDFNLNNFEDGVLSSAFMVGLLIASPIFASLAKSYNPFRLIGIGLSAWTLAVIGCGFSFNFWSISVCRMLVGVGEASFISLAPPFIDDNAPVSQASRKLGFPIFYGDGSRPAVLQSAGIASPKAVMIMYTGKKRTIEAVQRLRLAFPAIPIYARAQDLKHLLDLKKEGATDAILENAETSLQLGSKLLKGLGVMSDDVNFLSQLVRVSMELQAQEAISKTDDQEYDVVKPLQVRVSDSIGVQEQMSAASSEEKLPRRNQTDAIREAKFQGSTDGAASVNESSQAEDLQGLGVLYCDLGVENGSAVTTDEASTEKRL